MLPMKADYIAYDRGILVERGCDPDSRMVDVALFHYNHADEIDEVFWSVANETHEDIAAANEELRNEACSVYGFRNSDCVSVIFGDVDGEIRPIGTVSPNGRNIRLER